MLYTLTFEAYRTKLFMSILSAIYQKYLFSWAPKKRKIYESNNKKTISCITFTRACVKISMNQIFCHFYCLMVFCGFCLSKATDVIFIFILVTFCMYGSYYNTFNEIDTIDTSYEIECSGMNKKLLFLSRLILSIKVCSYGTKFLYLIIEF